MERNTNPNGAIRRPRERDEPVRPLIERYRADPTIADTFPEEYRRLLRLHYIDYHEILPNTAHIMISDSKGNSRDVDEFIAEMERKR